MFTGSEKNAAWSNGAAPGLGAAPNYGVAWSHDASWGHATAPDGARIIARQIAKSYGPVPALAGVDVTIYPGESVAIMGPSGCGKSTLLQILAGVLTPDAGTVGFNGQVINQLTEAERSRLRLTEFGFVFQDGQLLPELNNAENVSLPLVMAGKNRQEASQAGREWLARFGLAGAEKRRPSELSGGQSARVAIARALVHHPSLVFADEPTGALDQSTGAEVMRILVGATSSHGSSLLVVTHDPTVASWCRRVITMRDGAIVSGQTKPNPMPMQSPRPGQNPLPPHSPLPSQYPMPGQEMPR